MCLLNSILNGKPHIKNVTLDPTEYKKKTKDGKSMRLDIAATTDDGTRINIETQCYEVDNIEDRAAFYRYQLQERELHAGADYSSVPNIISIWILTENATNRKSCCSEMVMMYKDNGVDLVEIASEPLEFLDIPEVKEAMDELTVMSMDQQIRDEYNTRIKQLNDYQALKTAAEKVEEKARFAEEKLEKAKKEKVEVAKRMLVAGLSFEQVV